MKIRHLTYQEIDKYKWDKCISQSYNGIVYAYSWYLDIVSEKWEALVLNDYETVMPLPTKKKYGINYIIQPKYTQQLGVFSRSTINDDIITEFINHIPKKYKFIDLNFNTYNKINTKNIQGRTKEMITCELDLIPNYQFLYKNYTNNAKKNIKKAEKKGLHISKDIKLKDFLMLIKQKAKYPVNIDDLNILRRIIPFSISHKIGINYGIYNANNELIAGAFFVRSNYKYIYLLSVSNEESFSKSGMFAIINQFIKDNAEKNITLDFEGSNIESIAEFFKGFGAKPIKYSRVIISHLPWFFSFWINKR